MGCAPSKPSRPRSRAPETPFPRYTGPKKFRGSRMPERRPRDHESSDPRSTGPKEYRGSVMAEHRPHRQAAQMYQTYQEQDRQRGIWEARRNSWEGHASERVFTTFDSLAERGIIDKKSLRKE